MYVYYNPNPAMLLVEDCVIRAVSKALEIPWEKAYMGLSLKGLELYNWGNANNVWGAYLKDKGFIRESVPNTCPDCYTVRQFCDDHPRGTYVIGTGKHAVACVDGSYYDNWDSGQETVLYSYRKE
jgi:hypothetical protein